MKFNIVDTVIRCSDEQEGTYHSPVDIIRNCKNTLKRLHLRSDQGQMLNDCLEICPNLECLIYDDHIFNYYDEDQEEFERLSLPPGPYQLRQLAIRCDSNTNLDIDGFIGRCPHLESFHLYCPGLDYRLVMQALLEHCPNVRTVEISSESTTWNVSWIPAKAQHDIKTSSLLRKLTFNDDPTDVMDELRIMIDKSKTSLEKLDVWDNREGAMLYQVLITAQIVNLRELWCAYARDQKTTSLLQALIESSPRLERVYIPRFGISDAVLSVLGQLYNLIQLRFYVDQPVTYNGLTLLFSQSLSLQDVDHHHTHDNIYHQSHIPIYEVLQALAGCRSLQKLQLSSNAWRRLTETQTTQLERETELQQSGLQEVTLVCYGGMGQTSLRIWSGLKQLRRLEIKEQTNAPFISSARVQQRIDQDLNIPNLRIYWYQSGNWCRTFILDSNGRCNMNYLANTIVYCS